MRTEATQPSAGESVARDNHPEREELPPLLIDIAGLSG